jgi:hypothetical protein
MADNSILEPQKNPKFVMYSGDAEPKPLHPPRNDEVHFWTNSKDEHRVLNEGVWVLI